MQKYIHPPNITIQYIGHINQYECILNNIVYDNINYTPMYNVVYEQVLHNYVLEVDGMLIDLIDCGTVLDTSNNLIDCGIIIYEEYCNVLNCGTI